MKPIYSLALFRSEHSAYEKPEAGAGRGVFFKGYLPALMRSFRSVYRDWELVIHHDNRVLEWEYFRVLEAMHARGLLRLVPKGTAWTLCGSMMFRLCPIFEEGADVVLCRDVDSLPTPRDRRAVDKWIASGHPCHAAHDSISHMGTPLLGGMVGFRAPWFREKVAKSWGAIIEECNEMGIDLNQHGADQQWLNRAVWPLAQKDGCVYDTPDTLGGKDDPRDDCDGYARGVGGAYHAGPVADWYDKHHPDEELLAIEREILGEVKP